MIDLFDLLGDDIDRRHVIVLRQQYRQGQAHITRACNCDTLAGEFCDCRVSQAGICVSASLIPIQHCFRCKSQHRRKCQQLIH